MFLICNLCDEAGEEFIVPNDFIGRAIMREHQREKHGDQCEPTGTERS